MAGLRSISPPFSLRNILIVSSVLTGGCMSMPDMANDPPPPRAANAQAVSRPAPALAPAQTQSSALSYGTVTSIVQKGKTTQLDLVTMFGGPSISSTDADGNEVWIYERSVTQTDIASQNREYQGAVNLGASFGFGSFTGTAGGGLGTSRAAGQSSSVSTTRNLTVIVKFNSDKTVKDYSVRASTF
jgi:hypothetical protein